MHATTWLHTYLERVAWVVWLEGVCGCCPLGEDFVRDEDHTRRVLVAPCKAWVRLHGRACPCYTAQKVVEWKPALSSRKVKRRRQ